MRKHLLIRSTSQVRATIRQIVGLKTIAVHPTGPSCCQSVTWTSVQHLLKDAHDALGQLRRRNTNPLRLSDYCASISISVDILPGSGRAERRQPGDTGGLGLIAALHSAAMTTTGGIY